jgi:hypothetical protein
MIHIDVYIILDKQSVANVHGYAAAIYNISFARNHVSFDAAT